MPVHDQGHHCIAVLNVGVGVTNEGRARAPGFGPGIRRGRASPVDHRHDRIVCQVNWRRRRRTLAGCRHIQPQLGEPHWKVGVQIKSPQNPGINSKVSWLNYPET